MVISSVRRAAADIIERFPGAFLRCDRGTFLYLTDAPARGDGAGCAALFEKAGFEVQTRGALLYIAPGIAWREPFVLWARPRCVGDPLSGALRALSGRVHTGAERALWIEGLKLIDLMASEGAVRAYDRQVRQRAAVCLRTLEGGGLMEACALCASLAARGERCTPGGRA